MRAPGAGPIPARLAGLCDDAAIFPPGSAPLGDAVAAHLRHRAAPYADLVGPLVLSAAALAQLRPHVEGLAPGQLAVSATLPEPRVLTDAIAHVVALPAVRLAALEIALPEDLAAADAVPTIDAALAAAGAAAAEALLAGVQVYVEVPRDARRPELLAALAGSKHRAKFRTGGVEARLYPNEAELAEAIARTVALGLPFKATAGLHHAIRNTDPDTRFEQHGFLNVLLATAAALRGEPVATLVAILADRDGPAVAAACAALTESEAAAARAAFVSFGTCSVTDPLTELTDLGLTPLDYGAHR